MSFMGRDRALLGPPAWVMRGAVADCDFANGRRYGAALDVVTRASIGTAADTIGAYSTFASNAARRTDLGVRMESARTNLVRNPRGEGANAGTPEVLPDNWLYTPSSGLASQCLGQFTVDGVACTRFRIFGTAAGVVGNLLFWERATGIAAVSGDTITGAVFLRLVAAAVPLSTGISTFKITGRENNAAGTVLLTFVPTGGIELDGTLRRKPFDYTMTQATAAAFQPCLRFVTIDGGAVDFTIDIGWPQIEKNVSRASSPIPNAVYVPGPNLVPNPSAAGAVAGTPGTMPTGWSYGAASTLAPQVVGVFTVDGIPCLRLRIFDANPTRTASTNVCLYTSTTAVNAVQGDTILNTVYLRIQAGDMTGIASIRVGGRETSATGTTLVTLSNEAAVTLTGTLTQRRDQYVMTSATAAHFQGGFVILPAATGAIDITLDIGLPALDKNNSVTSTAPARAVDALSFAHPVLKGAAGGIAVEFAPGELLTSYTIFQFADAADPTNNYVSVRYTDADTLVFTRVAAGVADADVQIATSRLVTRVASRVVMGFSASAIFISLNGRAAITIAKAMPFSGLGKILIGALDGWLRRRAFWAAALSAQQVQTWASNNTWLRFAAILGQSNGVGSHAFVDYLLGSTSFIMPAAFTQAPSGYPREFMFLVKPETLSTGGVKISDPRMGTNRTSGGANADDMRVDLTDLLSLTPMISRQFSTSSGGFTVVENIVRRLARLYGPGNVIAGATAGVGGAGVRSMLEVPTVPLPNGVVVFSDLMNAVQRASDVAAIQGWQFDVVLFHENGHTSGNDPQPADEAAVWEPTLRTQVLAAVQAISPGSNPAFVGELFSDFPNDNRAGVLCNVLLHAGGNWIMSGPTYAWTTLNGTQGYYGDFLHYNALGNARSGERVANAAFTKKLTGTYDHCRVLSGVRVGATITLALNVPVPPLVRDVVNVPVPTYDGMDGIQVLLTSDLSALTISSISISPDNALVIQLSADPGAGIGTTVNGALFGYVTPFTDHYIASEQARTVYRDSSTAVFDYDGAPNYNWVAPFTLALP